MSVFCGKRGHDSTASRLASARQIGWRAGWLAGWQPTGRPTKARRCDGRAREPAQSACGAAAATAWRARGARARARAAPGRMRDAWRAWVGGSPSRPEGGEGWSEGAGWGMGGRGRHQPGRCTTTSYVGFGGFGFTIKGYM